MAEYKPTIVNNGRGKPMAVPSFIKQAHLDYLANSFQVYDDDLYIVTYPRAGTNWMLQIVHLLTNEGRQGEQRLDEAVPWLESLPGRHEDMAQALANMPRPRRFYSHLPIQLMPGVYDSRAKYIYLARNPKDCAVSCYHHEVGVHGYKGSWADYFDLFYQGQVMFGQFFDHVLEWWQASQQMEQILFLTYEQMCQNLTLTVEEVAAFVDVPLDNALLAQVVEESRFDKMAANPKANFNWISRRDGTPGHMRKGAVGDWRNYFTVAQDVHYDALVKAKVLGTGLLLDFGDGLILP